MLELKDIFESLGFNADEIKTKEDFLKATEKTFIRASNLTEDHELIKPIIGKFHGIQESELKKIAKENEIDLNSDDFKEAKRTTDKFNILASKMKGKYSAELEILKSNVGKGSDELVKELQNKLEKQSSETRDYKNLLNSTKTEYEQFQEKSKGEMKNVKLNVIKQNELSKIKFKPEMTDIERRGYFSKLNDEYDLDLEEDDTLIIKNKKGERIKSGKTVGSFKSAFEVFEEEAIKASLYQLNKDAGKPKPIPMAIQQQKSQSPGKQERRIAPRML